MPTAQRRVINDGVVLSLCCLVTWDLKLIAAYEFGDTLSVVEALVNGLSFPCMELSARVFRAVLAGRRHDPWNWYLPRVGAGASDS